MYQDLLTSFKQDITNQCYQDFNEVLIYCKHSAGPVGRLLLHLIAQVTPKNFRQSDAICSALQLINFLQEISLGYDENGRI